MASTSRRQSKEKSLSTATLLAGPLDVRDRDLDTRTPERVAPSIDVAHVELGLDMLRASIDTFVFRPLILAAAVNIGPIALDQALRAAGI